jgi:transcriptional regulator with PAS, ATPase and Fis domain
MTDPTLPLADADGFRWQALFQRAAEPLFLLNRRRRLVFANAAWQQLTGIPAREARTLVCKRYRAAEPGSREAVLHALSPPPEVLAGAPARVRRVVVQPGAGEAAWEVAFFPFREANELLGIMGRITVAPAAPAAGAPLPARLLTLRDRRMQWHQLDHFGGGRPAIRRAREQMRLAAQTLVPVLLAGEPGVGKEWAARAIHQQSGVGSRAFASLDCGRLPAAVVAAALFDGHGLAHRPGVGTLYLREPQGLPRELQARLAELAGVPCGPGEGQRLGPRLMAGCSQDPREEVRQGRLLDELCCALGVVTIALPPLRERPEDLGRLVQAALARAGEAGARRPSGLSTEAWEIVRAWTWPGNLRELLAVLQGACGRARGDHIEAEDLPWYVRSAPPSPPRSLPLQTILQEVERRLIQLALKATRQNKTKAAKLLEVWRALLVRRIKALGIDE